SDRQLSTVNSSMRLRFIPGTGLLIAFGVGFALVLTALVSGIPVSTAYPLAIAWSVLVLLATLVDRQLTLRSWREAAPELSRMLPAAFALGVASRIHVYIRTGG